MDNFMEQPTYKMNRGAILPQGCQRLVQCRSGGGGGGGPPRFFSATAVAIADKPAPADQVMSAGIGASRPMACSRA
ncbi:hypothetical protein C1X91_04380 [Pseudomonas sp. GP01-A5]|nr:hypothetical protein C1X91_04380 [Pseudomonas sp. GP01-A5]